VAIEVAHSSKSYGCENAPTSSNTIDEVICMPQHNNLEMILSFLVGLPTYVPL
jgi:hypothetical protein